MKGRRPWLFFGWLVAFYATWLAMLILGNHFRTVVVHWPIAVAMSVGSYFAGSTPMGGGTVGFPVLVLLFGKPASMGRDFSFAIQAIGMTSASIYLIATNKHVAWSLLRWAIAGSVVGTPLGLTFIAPHMPGSIVKVLFALVWSSFGVMTLRRMNGLAKQDGVCVESERVEMWTGLAVGFFGGSMVAAVTGVGIDMVLYVVLVLARRADVRVGVTSSVVLMAATSVVGILWQTCVLDVVDQEVFGHWLAAAPVVAVGAPLGARVVAWIGRRPTLLIVAVLCVAQLAWTLSQEHQRLGWLGIGSCGACLLLALKAFDRLSRWGDELAREPAPLASAATLSRRTEVG